MKNFKIISSTIIIDYIYCLLTFFFSFVVAEYVYDIFTDFNRFKLMHSLVDNIYFVLIFIGWILLTIFIVKYTRNTIKVLSIKKFAGAFKSKKYLVITSCAVVLLVVGWLVSDSLNIKPPRLYLSSEFSKTIQAISGSYSWSNWHESVMADSMHPTEFQYTPDNTLAVGRNVQIILSNKEMKIDRRYPFELSNLECFDKNNVIVNYKVSPTYSNGDLYINTPSVNGVYICNVVLKYKQGTVSYGYKLVAVNDVVRLNDLYANKTDYVGDNSKVSKIAHDLTVMSQVGWLGIELQTKDEPYGLTINYSIADEDFGQINLNSVQDTFQKNAIVMFSLIGNVENITINLKQGEKVMASNYSRKMADEYMKQDVRNLAKTEYSFGIFLSQLYSDAK